MSAQNNSGVWISVVVMTPMSVWGILAGPAWAGWIMLAICLVNIWAMVFPPAHMQPTQTRWTAKGIERVRAGKAFESVDWDQLVRVQIMTTDEGPFVEDFFFMLIAADGTGVAVPNGDACAMDLMKVLGALPGFDFMAVVVASGSCDWATFDCWEGTGEEASRAIQQLVESDPELEDQMLTFAFSL